MAIAGTAPRAIQMKDGRIVNSQLRHHRTESAMTFFTVVIRGLMRRPVRTGLTLVGISIGIGAVVTLVGISRGFEQSWETGMKARGTDIVVNNMGSALTPKPFDASVRDRIAGLPGVAETSVILVELISIEDAPMMMVSAREWGGFTWKHLKVDFRAHAKRRRMNRPWCSARPQPRCSRKRSAIRFRSKRREIVGGRDRRRRRARRKRLGDSFPAAAPGNHRKRRPGSTSSTSASPRRPEKPRSKTLCDRITGLIPEARADAGRRTHPQQPGLSHGPGDELGHFPAGRARRRPRRDEHDAHDRIRAHPGDLRSARPRLEARADRAHDLVGIGIARPARWIGRA